MKIRLGDCLEEMRTMEDNSVDSIVTDPPYGLSFMGKKWDYDVPSVEIWKECLRVLKPGGYLLSFAGTRTQHRMCVNIEDAGFEIRDMIAWVYGSGFPKSHNIGKAVDKLQGNKREVVGVKSYPREGTTPVTRKATSIMGQGNDGNVGQNSNIETKGNSPYEGWGTALKPALEPITVARKPFKGTVANNVLKWGTGGINIDGCRVEYVGKTDPRTFGGSWKTDKMAKDTYEGGYEGTRQEVSHQGRFPANLIHDGSDEVVGLFPETKPSKKGARGGTSANPMDWGNSRTDGDIPKGHDDNGGSAARFFYCAKASKSERNEGCEGLEREKFTAGNYSQSPVCKTCNKTLNGTNDHTKCSGEVYYREMKSKITANNHPTVKPVKLMQYLVRLVTPKDGTVLDPFMGSGSTGKACMMEGFDFIGIELAEDYFEIAKARIEKFEFQHELFEK